MKIINVPIEPLEERYSAQWGRWFINYFKDNDIDYITVKGKSYNSIRDGAFLDVVQTNRYKAEQLAEICTLLEKEEQECVIFLHDLWFPGLEMLAYIRDGLGLNFKICGCLHAGTYDPNDFLAKKGMGTWGKKLEESWFKIINTIFVATNYHRQLLLSTRKVDHRKIYVTGFPIYKDEIDMSKGVRKENIVVFPHRLDDEKRPDLFHRLAKECKTMHEFKGWKFLMTKHRCKTKEEYYRLLAISKIAVSFAEQETWGIAMQEAVFNGCYPIVPDRLSYSEMYDFHQIKNTFLYSDWEGLLKCMLSAKNKADVENIKTSLEYRFSSAGEKAIHNMVNIMKLL